MMVRTKKMKALFFGLLLVYGAGVTPAREQYSPIRISIKPVIDIPLPRDSNLFSLGGGYFYVFENGEPSSWATNISLQGEYRWYGSLYHLIGIGLGLEHRLDWDKQGQY